MSGRPTRNGSRKNYADMHHGRNKDEDSSPARSDEEVSINSDVGSDLIQQKRRVKYPSRTWTIQDLRVRNWMRRLQQPLKMRILNERKNCWKRKNKDVINLS